MEEQNSFLEIQDIDVVEIHLILILHLLILVLKLILIHNDNILETLIAIDREIIAAQEFFACYGLLK